jgi:cell division cycle 14
VVRLNDRLYDPRPFEERGIKVHGLEFPDGSNPQDHIISKFMSIMDAHISQGQAVAVHCRAGLGRTGVLIGCYIMTRIREG